MAGGADPLIGLAIPPDRYALLFEVRGDLALLSWIWAEEVHDLGRGGRLAPHLRRRAASLARDVLDDLPAEERGG